MSEDSGKSRYQYFVFLVGFFDLLAVSLVIPALPVYFKSMHISPTLSGVIKSIYGALQLFSSPIVGKWSDKAGRMKVLAMCLLICSAGYVSLAYFMHCIVCIAIVRIVPGIFKHTQDICRCVLLEEKKTSNNAVLGAFNAIASIGFVIGPTVHGHLVDRFGLNNGFLISCVMCYLIFVINFIITLCIGFFCGVGETPVLTKVPKQENASHCKNGKIEPCLQYEQNKNLTIFHKGVLASRFFLSLGVMVFRFSFVLWLFDCHPDMPSTTVGYIQSYNGVLGTICGFLVGIVSKLPIYRDNEEKMQFHASMLLILSLVLLTLFDDVMAVLIILTMATMSTSVLRVCGVVLSVKHLPKDEIGRMNGLGSSVISVARFAAPILVGLLQEVSFSAPNYVALLLSCMGTIVYCMFSYPLSVKKKKID